MELANSTSWLMMSWSCAPWSAGPGGCADARAPVPTMLDEGRSSKARWDHRQQHALEYPGGPMQAVPAEAGRGGEPRNAGWLAQGHAVRQHGYGSACADSLCVRVCVLVHAVCALAGVC